jgi:hypothetical protein
MILTDVADNAEAVEVTATTVSSYFLLEGDLHAGDVVPVPYGVECAVAEPQREDILDHLLGEKVVDPVHLFLSERIRHFCGKLPV